MTAYVELDPVLQEAVKTALIDTFGTADPREMSYQDRVTIAATAFAMKRVCGQMLNGDGAK